MVREGVQGVHREQQQVEEHGEEIEIPQRSFNIQSFLSGKCFEPFLMKIGFLIKNVFIHRVYWIHKAREFLKFGLAQERATILTACHVGPFCVSPAKFKSIM